MDSTYLYGLGLALKNACNMLRDRGYVPVSGVLSYSTTSPGGTVAGATPYDISGAVYARSIAAECSLGESSRCTFECGSKTIMLWCFDRNYDTVKGRDRMISTDQVKALQDLLCSAGAATGSTVGHTVEHIVLSPTKLSPQAKKERLDAELFLFDELLIDIPRHELVVPHRVVTETAVKSVLGTTLKTSDLPVMLRTDAMARWYNWPIGTLVFLDNPEVPSYRIVSDG